MSDNKLTEVYQSLLKRVREAKDNGEKISQSYWEKFEENLIKIEHFSEKEAEQLVTSLQRDLSEARQVLHEAGHAISQWLKWDAALLEDKLEDWIEIVADETWIDWIFLKNQWQQLDTYQTGDLIGLGQLHCVNCGQLLHFKEAGQIPACPHCQGTTFGREPIH